MSATPKQPLRFQAQKVRWPCLAPLQATRPCVPWAVRSNDLAYRGYDILDVATACEFEEIAHLLVHGKLPNAAELAGYKAKLKALRGLPAGESRLEQLPPIGSPHGRDAHGRVGAGLRQT